MRSTRQPWQRKIPTYDVGFFRGSLPGLLPPRSNAQYPAAMATKDPDIVCRVFRLVIFGKFKTTACEERSFYVEFFL